MENKKETLEEFAERINPTIKQETLEQAAIDYCDRFFGKDRTSYQWNNGYTTFINAAKWCQEKSYSEEEVKIMYRSLWVGNSFDFDTSYEMESNFEHDFNLWFEKFKKK